MTYRNDLAAAHTQIAALRDDKKRLQALIDAKDAPSKAPPSAIRTQEQSAKGRFRIRYERPKTFWPMLEDSREMVSFFSKRDSDSIADWAFAAFGFIAAVGFFMPIQIVLSIAILPLVPLAGIKVGRRR